jgi:hypothetical protein
MYTYRKMKENDLSKVKQFFSCQFDKKSHQNCDGWFEWQYLNNPKGFHAELCFCGNDLIGFSGFLPAIISIKGRNYTSSFSTNTIVDKQHRNKGIGNNLHEKRVASYDIALSSGQSAANYNLYIKKKWLICDT